MAKKPQDKTALKTGSSSTAKPIAIRSSDQLATAIQRLRKQQNMTQIELAQKAGVTQSTISRLEGGQQQAEISTLVLICAALGAELTISEKTKAPAKAKPSYEGLY